MTTSSSPDVAPRMSKLMTTIVVSSFGLASASFTFAGWCFVNMGGGVDVAAAAGSAGASIALGVRVLMHW